MMTRSPARILKRCSLCSTLAIATSLVLGPSPAAAQSFQGTVDAGTVGAIVDQSTVGQTNVTITQQQAVINWTATSDPSGSTIVFQPDGTTATFAGASDFAVLNRVTPGTAGYAIYMGGSINSLIGEGIGGTVYFYSPNGIVIGQNASINVGSLGLTTSQITDDGQGNWMSGFGTASPSVTFGAANPGSYVRTNVAIDGSINANGFGSYVAMVAPIVQHNGIIRTDSGAALVAAEAATITFNQNGLYDIEVTTGTDSLQPLTVNGGTISRNSQTIGGDRHAYLVAVPKNDAITLLVVGGAQLGFDIAGSAGVEGNTVVLSAGRDIAFGSASGAPVSAAAADVTIDNAAISSNLFADASNIVQITTWNGATTFTGDIDAHGDTLVGIQSTANSLTVGGDVFADADAIASGVGESALAGEVRLGAHLGTTLSITGGAYLSADAEGGSSSTAGIASGSAQGGIVSAYAIDSGTLSIGGPLLADASGHGGSFFTESGFIDGGDGFGGTVNVFTSGDSSMTVAGGAILSANGIAGQASDCFQCGGIGGIGDAGSVNVQAHTGTPDNNTMAFASTLTINANGIGGDGQSGGLGLGGNVILSSADSSIVTVASDVLISASGGGGSAFGAGGDGGAGFGGISDVAADNASLDITGSLDQYLFGEGGNSELGNGGYGEGGFGELFALNGGNVAIGTYASIYATGDGGDGLASGGEGQGGSAYFSSSSGGTLTLGSFSWLVADGQGGDAYDVDVDVGNGGLGEGGHVEAYANDATLNVQETLWLLADGEGGSAGGGMDAGDSLGGDVYLQAVDGGILTVAGGLYASAVGIGDYISGTTNSGDGIGGFIGIYARDNDQTPAVGDSTLTVSGPVDLDVDGVANAQGECFPCGGIGGIGQGGTIDISSQGLAGLNGNVLTFAGDLTATANGYGGAGVGGAAGDGFGGTVEIFTVDGNSTNDMNFANVIAEASGYGGDSDPLANGTGGNGTGGTASLYNPAGTIHIAGDLELYAQGFGGNSGGSTGVGGDGFGKLAQLVNTGGDITIDGSAIVDASGTGGNGFDAGDGFGGGDPDLAPEFQTDGAYIRARNGDIRIGVGGVETGAYVISNGYGGSANFRVGGGGSGGNGSGGWASMFAQNSDLGPSSITSPTTFMSATGEGGDGGNGDSGGDGSPGGDGGIGTGGFVGQTAGAGNGLLDIGDAYITVAGYGGRGGDGGSADGGIGGNGGNGGAAFGGFSNVGTSSGVASIAQAGVGNFNSITIEASAYGGDGGDGGIFGSPDGNGGNGGSATGGTAVLLVRGSTLNVNSVGLLADAVGGNGGSGAVIGDGGDATSGGVGVLVTKRFNETARGQLNAGSIIGNASATGGTGAASGASLTGGGSLFTVTDSDASIGSLAFTITAADGNAPGAPENAIRIANGDVFVLGDFSFITPGDMSLFADNGAFGGSMTVGGTLTLTAGNFVADTVLVTQVDAGTYFADAINITTGLNFLTTANLDSGSDLTIVAPGFIGAADIDAAGFIDLEAQGGAITTLNLSATGDVNLLADTSITTGAIFGGAAMTINALGGSVMIGDLTAIFHVDMDATESVTVGEIDTGSIYIDAVNGGISTGNIVADGDIILTALNGAITGGDFSNSAGWLILNGNSIQAGNFLAAGLLSLQASGAIDVGNANSVSYIEMLAGGDADFDALVAGSYVDIDAGGDITGGNVDAATFLSLVAGGDISVGDLTAADDIFADAGGAANFGTVDSTLGSVQLNAVGTLSFVDISAGTFVTIDPTDIVGGDVTALAGDVDMTGNSIDIGNVSASDNVFLTALAGNLTTLAIDAGLDVTLDATGNVTTGNITAGGLIDATGASLTLGNLSAHSIALTTTVADLTVGNVTIPGDLTLNTAGDLIFGNLDAFDVDLAATGSITGGDIDSATDITAIAGTDINLGNLEAGGFFVEVFLNGSVDLAAGGDINTGGISAFGDVFLDAGASITTLDIDAQNAVELFAGGSISTGDILAGDYILAVADFGAMTLGDLSSDNIDLDAATALIFGNANAGTQFDFESNGTVTGGNITAGVSAGGDAQGAIALGTITAGLSNPETLPEDGFSVGIASETSITVGDVTGAHAVGFATLGPLTTGDISAGELFMGLVSGNMNLGSIETGAAGQVYLADASMFIAAGGVDNFDASLVLAAAPVATGGSITIGGPVSTGLFQAAAGSDLSTVAITAQTIEASAGGTATLNGLWSAPSVLLTSNDIDIGALGGIDAGNTGLVTLQSTNATQALIGDGLTGTGYALSNAEFGRISSGSLYIQANGNASAAADMLIGDLSITGPLAGSTIDDPNGIVLFATGDLETLTPGGVIRVVGDVEATGFVSGNALEFQSGRFELDAATGSISVEGLSNALGGILDITADRIHVASGNILDQLATNPHYAGYQDDLNDPATVQRPDGVIRASNIFVQPTEAVLVQNTGTDDIPAGFVANSVELTAPEGALPGSIELIVNGQLVTETGTLTKIAVRDALVAEFDISVFTDNSTINGCALTGDCVERPILPQIPGIPTQVTLISEDMLDEQPFGNEPVIDNEEDEETSSPIQPPAPLFDTRPLNPDADVDEPISGSGNPALIGAGPVNNGDQQ